MAVNLTGGAIAMMCNGDNAVMEMNPVVQVTDLRLVNSTQQQTNAQERYRLVLSDGEQQQQGMLATQKNELVKSGRLQKGSIVQLTQFVCNTIQNRRIVIIIDLNVMLERSDLIGNPANPVMKPKPSVPGQSSTDQPGSLGGTNQSFGGSVSAGQAPNTGTSQYPRMDQSNRSPYATNVDPERNAAKNPPLKFGKAESGARFPGPPVPGGGYSNQNMGFNNPKVEALHPPNAYGRPAQSGYQQPPPMYMNRGPVTRNEAPPRIIPISALNPYQGRWTIKARVTAKGDLRRYNNARGDGKVFSFDLLDSDGGEIRVTCFNSVADQFYNQIEAGRVYLISKGNLKPAQRNFNHLNNDHEIFLETTSIIQPCSEDDSSIPQQQFHFRSIGDIESMENNSVVDLIGVVTSINPTSSIMRKNGTETQKRTLQLKDMSGRSVEITLWGNLCNAEGHELQILCDRGVFPVLAVKSGRVNDFNGKAVSTIATSQLFIEPEFAEARRLKEWFANEGKSMPSVSISREISSVVRTDVRKTISQIKGERLGTSEKPDWITVSATITFIKMDNFCYTACPIKIGDRQCNRKVTNNGDGKWRCERCDQCVDECDYRYILQFQIQDHTGLTWVTAFQECGEEVVGMPAKELYYLKYEEQDDERFAEITRQVCFNKYIFKLKVKEEMFNDEMRVKSTVVKAEKMNFSSESRILLDLMEKLKTDETSSSKVQSTLSNMGMSSVGADTGSRQPASAPSYSGNYNAPREYGLPATNQGSHFGNQYGGSRQSTTQSLYCNSCGSAGHMSLNCPSLNGPGDSMGGGYSSRPSPVTGAGGAAGECYKCHQPGHWARDCPGDSVGAAYSSVPNPGTGAGGASGECYKCHQPGHWARDCPGSSAVPAAYGSSGYAPGRYGITSKQHIGGL